MEADDEGGQGDGGAPGGDVGGAGGLRLVTQVVGTVTVGLRQQQRNTDILTIFKHNSGTISYEENKKA